MIVANLPPETTGKTTGNERSADSSPLPFYRRSLFWLLLGLLAGIVLLFLLHSCQPKEEQAPSESASAPEAQSGEDRDAPFRDLLALQEAQNRGLEEEIRRLQQLLQEDPCKLPEVLGERPEQSPLAPGYVLTAPPASTGGKAQTDANATAVPADRDTSAAPDQAAPASTSETVGNLLDKATVFILSRNGGQTGMGSGFFVAPGIIATNSHVVQGPDAKVIVGNKALGGMCEARVIAFSTEDKRDYALLKISDTLAAKAPALMIARGAKRMERVSAWGFPGYIAEIDPKLKALALGDSRAVPEVVYSEGVVSVVLERTPPVILHTASISQGNSGGPLVNAQGVVVGINTFIKQANKSYSQTNIALTGEDLAKFIAEQGIQATMVNQ